MKLSEVIPKVIALAQASREYWDAELPKRHPDYPLIHPGEESGPPPPQELELRALLSELPEQRIYQLLVLMYLGRGDFDTGELAEQNLRLRETFAKPQWAVAQMMEKAPLADYLTEGLAKLRKKRIDVDRLPLKLTKARK